MNILHIETTDSAFEQFLELPQSIYRGTPYHRARPVEETRVLLDKEENPCWKNAQRALFLAEMDGEVIGRIAAIHDAEINRQHGRKDGFFGFFECIDDRSIAGKLFDAASQWLIEQGCCSAMRGPCNPLPDFLNLGILVEGFDQPQVTGEAFNPDYYPALIEGAGFKRELDFFSFRNRLQGNKVFDCMMQRLEKILKKDSRTTIRSFDAENFHRDAAIVNDVINLSFETRSFYSQVDLATQEFLLKNTVPLHEMGWFSIVEDCGRPVGVNLTAPNYDDLLFGDSIHGVRAENFAVLPDFQGTFAASSLFYHGWDKIRRSGSEDVYISYVSEDNTDMHRIVKSFGCEFCKRHRVYSKPF